MLIRESLEPINIDEVFLGSYSFYDDYTNQTLGAKIYKNPETLDDFDEKIRAISDLKGNLYVIDNKKLIHKRLLDYLNRNGIINNACWNNVKRCYDNIICWQRKGFSNTLMLGESYYTTDIDRFDEMLQKVKEKNKNITFVTTPINENINPLFKPKSKEDLMQNPIYKQADEFMTKIFSDLHKDHNNPNIYRNSKGEWMFGHDLKRGYIYVSYDRVWSYFNKNITTNYSIVKMLIESWLKENTDWPQLPIVMVRF